MKMLDETTQIAELEAKLQQTQGLLNIAEAYIERLEHRLEIDRCYTWDSKDGFKEVTIPKAERETTIDGIEARDCTIKLMDEVIVRLNTRLNTKRGRRWYNFFSP